MVEGHGGHVFTLSLPVCPITAADCALYLHARVAAGSGKG